MKLDVSFKFVVCVAVIAFASGAFGAWELTVGPAWRSRAKSRISGSVSVVPVAASSTVSYDQNIATHGAWTGAEPNLVTVVDPSPFALPGDTLWAATAIRTETTVTPGGAFAKLGCTDHDSPMGIKSSVGINVMEIGPVSISLNMRLAAYWRMQSSVSGASGGGTIRTDTFNDYYLFSSGPYPPGTSFAFSFPDTAPYLPYRTPTGSTITAFPANSVRARMKSDLYQIGFGPKASVCVIDWLEVYASVEVLCNLVHEDFDVNGISNSSTTCRLGFGAEAGAVIWLIDGIGLYAEAGYEWIDEANVKIGNAKALADFSSLVMSAGLRVEF